MTSDLANIGSEPRSRSTSGLWRDGGLFALLYFLGAELGHWLSMEPGRFATFWPPSGIYLAALLLCRRPGTAWPILAGAALLADQVSDVLLHEKTAPISLGLWMANTLEALTGAWILRRWQGGVFQVRRSLVLRHLMGMAIVTAAISAPLGAAAGALVVSKAYGGPLLSTWHAWWSGNVLGVLIVAPLILCWWGAGGAPWDRRRWTEAAFMLSTLAALAVVIFWEVHPRLAVPYQVFPILLWAALRLGLRGVTLALAVLAGIAVHAFIANGVAAHLTLSQAQERLVDLQTFLCICALSFLVLASVTDSMRQARGQLERLNLLLEDRVRERTIELSRTREQFQRLAESSPVGVFQADDAGAWVYVNDRSCALTGLGQSEVRGRGWEAALHPDDREAVLSSWQRALAQRTPFLGEFRLLHRSGAVAWVLGQAVPFGAPGGSAAGALRSDRLDRADRDRPASSGFIGTLTDITAQKQAEAALAEADRRKDEFLAMLGHELRNPLTPICNAVALLRLRGGQEPAVVRARDLIDRQARHLVRLVDDLLDIGRITRGTIRLEREIVDMSEVVAAALECSQPLLQARRHTLEVALPPAGEGGPLQVLGDRTRLAQVVTNLLNNAAKYTDEGGHVWMRLDREDEGVVLSVRDDGPGIPAEMLPRIFDLFIQVGRTLDRAQGGLGIGLTLVRRIVEMHGGSVSARSEGRGSEFCVYLPGAPTTTST